MFHDGSQLIGMHWFWWLFWIALVAVVFFSLWGAPVYRGKLPRETPREVLQRRLASGEISPEEYDKRKKLLDRDSGGKP